MTAEVGNGLLVPSWEEGKGPGKPSGGQKPNALANMPFTVSEGRSEEKNGAAEQKPELFETWTLFRSLQSHPFTRPGRGTVSSLGARQAWPELILAELFVVFICQDLTN